MLKKYSPIATLERFSKATARSLNDLSGKLAVICDTDGILHAFGEGKKELDGKGLSEDMDRIMRERRSYIANAAKIARFFLSVIVAVNIISSCQQPP